MFSQRQSLADETQATQGDTNDGAGGKNQPKEGLSRENPKSSYVVK